MMDSQGFEPVQFGDSLVDLFHHRDLGAVPMRLPAGQSVENSHAHPCDHVFLILEGQVWNYQIGTGDNTRLVEILGPGEWFGASCLTEQSESKWQAVAAVDSQLLRAPAERLLDLLPEHPEATKSMILHLASKLRTARDETARVMFDDCNQRLIKTLLRFSRSAAARRQGTGVVLRITHQQLAQAIGAARETISLALTDLRRRQLLHTGRNQIYFEPETLRAFLKHSASVPMPTARSA